MYEVLSNVQFFLNIFANLEMLHLHSFCPYRNCRKRQNRYQNTRHILIHDIPKYMTYPNTWHTQIHDIPKYMAYPNTWHTLIHDIPKNMTAPFPFYIFTVYITRRSSLYRQWAYSPHFSKVLKLCCFYASYMYLTSLGAK
jgi:hypothetical protein